MTRPPVPEHVQKLSDKLSNPTFFRSYCEDGRAHRWRIDEVAGRFSNGVCTYCQAMRQFDNLEPDLLGYYAIVRD